MQGPAGGALYLSNVCQQLSVSDTFLDNSARQGGAVAILNPALNSGRYILSVSVTAAGPTSIFRLPCGVDSALANATFADNRAVVSGGAVYAVSTPAVGSSPAEHHSLILLGMQIALQGLCVLPQTSFSTDSLQHPKLIWLQSCMLLLHKLSHHPDTTPRQIAQLAHLCSASAYTAEILKRVKLGELQPWPNATFCMLHTALTADLGHLHLHAPVYTAEAAQGSPSSFAHVMMGALFKHTSNTPSHSKLPELGCTQAGVQSEARSRWLLDCRQSAELC